MNKMYSSCTVCYELLTEEDKRINEKREVFLFPICKKCLDEATNEINKALKK